MADGTTRRGFLGWLGATAGSLAIYKSEVDTLATPASPDGNLESANFPAVDRVHPSSTFIIKNQGDKPMVIAYLRTPASTPTNEMNIYESKALREIRETGRDSKYGKFADGRRSEALLLPGEELSIIAVETKL